jgi:hypothetical protein
MFRIAACEQSVEELFGLLLNVSDPEFYRASRMSKLCVFWYMGLGGVVCEAFPL